MPIQRNFDAEGNIGKAAKLGQNDVPREIKTELGDACTYRHLHANDGVMWSFGRKNVAWTADAKKWHDVTP